MKIFIKNHCGFIMLLATLLFGMHAYAQSINGTLSNKQVIEKMFQVFANVSSKPTDFEQYMSTDYTQNADGHTLNYQGFLTHVQGLHNAMKSIHFTFEQIIAEGDVVATHHIANGVKQNGQHVRTEFFAFFTLKNHQIIQCQEVSRMLQGDATDQNLSYH